MKLLKISWVIIIGWFLVTSGCSTAVIDNKIKLPGYLGIKGVVVQLDEDIRNHPQYKGQTGVLVLGVMPGSPAAKGHMQPDDIIMMFDGEPINDFERLIQAISDKCADTTVVLQVCRDGKEITINVKLGVMPGQEPVVYDPKKSLPEETVKNILKELTERSARDQEIRNKIMGVMQTDSSDQKPNMGFVDPQLAGECQKIDMENTSWLIEIIGKYGWIDVERFGAKMSHNAFLLVQHSENIDLMRVALSFIEKDVRANKLDGEPYALLYDRFQMRLGKKQRYGSQIIQNAKGEWVVAPLEDRARVEEFRKELGLFSLATYLRLIEQQGGMKVKFADDETPDKTKTKE